MNDVPQHIPQRDVNELRDGALFAVGNYDVSPDGQHFIMLNSGEQERAATEISVLLNWFEELKRLAPTK